MDAAHATGNELTNRHKANCQLISVPAISCVQYVEKMKIPLAVSGINLHQTLSSSRKRINCYQEALPSAQVSPEILLPVETECS